MPLTSKLFVLTSLHPAEASHADTAGKIGFRSMVQFWFVSALKVTVSLLLRSIKHINCGDCPFMGHPGGDHVGHKTFQITTFAGAVIDNSSELDGAGGP